MSITTECGVLAAKVKCAGDSCGSAPEVTNVYGTARVPLYIYLGKTWKKNNGWGLKEIAA